MKRISILGSTGSIGVQTLDVVRAYPGQFQIIGLSAHKNIGLIKEQILEFKPVFVSVSCDHDAEALQDWVQTHAIKTEIVCGETGLVQVATQPNTDLLIVAIVGTASLNPTYQAILAGIPIALACKEVLVAAGDLIMTTAATKNVPVLPIDSEHAAIKQCLSGIHENPYEIQRLILTASGGPFWQLHKKEFLSITKKEALAHPKWHMGQKITIDSATLMNKGLEVIEAHYLFKIPYNQIDVVIHPQSIIHSMVEFTDATVLAQMSLPDMRLPIQYALTYPDKWQSPWPRLTFNEQLKLEFFKPDFDKFPLLRMAYEAGETGGSAPIILNAANEAAVGLFLDEKIKFMDIIHLVQKAKMYFPHTILAEIDGIIALDQEVKAYVRKHI